MRDLARRIGFVVCSIACAHLSLSHGQDVPSGVTYKRATAEVNAKAKVELESALTADQAPTVFLGDVISCGPMLWNDLKSSREPLLKDSTPVTMMLSLPEPLKAEGRGLRTQEQRNLFWRLVLEKFPQLKHGTVRVAKPNEIQYYWATIPFDIEEPFFAIETPTDIFIANLRTSGGATTLFWIDRVDDLRKLKK